MWIPLRGQIAWLSAIEISCFPVPRPLSFHLVTFYVQKQNSSLAEQPGWKWGRRQLGFQFRGSRGIPLRSHPKGGSFALKKTGELWFLKWIKKWTTERDNIRKLILSLAELANSQERSDDSSIVNNYYFVIKRRGTWKVQWPLSQITFMLQKHTHPLEKKKNCLAPWVVRRVPTTPACSRFVLSCVISIHFGWKWILFILVFLNWAGNQHNIALLCELLDLSLQVISLYSGCVEPTHLAAGFKEMLVIGTYLCFTIRITSGHNCSSKF